MTRRRLETTPVLTWDDWQPLPADVAAASRDAARALRSAGLVGAYLETLDAAGRQARESWAPFGAWDLVRDPLVVPDPPWWRRWAA